MIGFAKMDASLCAEMSLIKVADVRGKVREPRMWVRDNRLYCFEGCRGARNSEGEDSIWPRLRFVPMRLLAENS